MGQKVVFHSSWVAHCHPHETRELFHRFHAQQQAKGKAWEKILENKIPSTLPGSVFTDNFHLVTGHEHLQRHLNRIGIKDLPMCPLYDNAAKMDLGHIQKC
jgi:hypothetical protein